MRRILFAPKTTGAETIKKIMSNYSHHKIYCGLKPLTQSEVSSGDLELTRYKSAAKAICVGLANPQTVL